MKSVRKSVLLPYSPQEMFELVSAVPDYPRFLPWCSFARVLQVLPDGKVAEVGIGLAGVQQSFVTRNTELPRNGPLRQTFAAVKMPDQGPVFQGDHPSNLIGWPTFQPSRLAGFSTVVNSSGLAANSVECIIFVFRSPGQLWV